jgi:uncharacterized membrane protein
MPRTKLNHTQTPDIGITGHHPDQIGLERLVFFSDAVFAIAITLLVLEIRLPAGVGDLDNAGLLGSLLGIWHQMFAYVISFLVIGSTWVAHHRKFRFVRKYDGALITLNLFFLMIIAFIPFPSSVISENPNRTATIFYALVIVLSGLFSAGIGWHLLRKPHLLDPSINKLERQRLYLAPLLTAMAFALSIGLAYIDPGIARLSWLLLLPISFYFNRK